MNVKKIRESLGLSQKEFAEVVGCAERTVRYWEAGAYEPDPRNRDTLVALKEGK